MSDSIYKCSVCGAPVRVVARKDGTLIIRYCKHRGAGVTADAQIVVKGVGGVK